MQTVRLHISLCIIASNEERNLERCLANAAEWVEEIIVVHNDCRDQTVAVAQKFGARTIERPFVNYPDQKNFTLAQATKPWVLSLDADEVVSPELKAAIFSFFACAQHEQYHGARFPRLNHFLGRALRHGDQYPDLSLRLFRAGSARFAGSGGHDNVEVDGPVVRLRGDLLHYSNVSLSRQIEKINFFSDHSLKAQLEKGKRWSLLETLTRPAWRFFRAYFIRLGFLDGFPGLYQAILMSFACFVRYSRLYEHERKG